MLRNKNAIITSVRRGIGRACVEAFAGYGANVWACARMEDPAFVDDMKELAERHGVIVTPLFFDMRDREGMKDAVRRIRADRRPVGALVNNAGAIAPSATFEMMSEEVLRDVFEVNFITQTIFTQFVIRMMARGGGGSIVNISSVAAFDGEPGQYEYATSKAASAGAAVRLAREFGGRGIRVNAVAPGVIETDMTSVMATELMERAIAKTSLDRLGQAREVAEVAAFLASDRASYVTGQIIRVDGGM